MSEVMKEQNAIPVAGKIGDNEQAKGVRTHQHYRDDTVGDGAKTVFFLSKSPSNSDQVQVYVAGLLKRPSSPGVAHDYSISDNKVTFVAAPGAGADIAFTMASV